MAAVYAHGPLQGLQQRHHQGLSTAAAGDEVSVAAVYAHGPLQGLQQGHQEGLSAGVPAVAVAWHRD